MGARICRTLSPIPGYVLRIAVYLAITVVFDVPIAIIGVAVALANLAAVWISAKKREDDIRAYSRDVGVLQGDISRTIDGIETIKSCGAEDVTFLQLTSAGTQVINNKTRMDQTGVYTTALFSFLNALCSGMILIVGVLGDFVRGHQHGHSHIPAGNCGGHAGAGGQCCHGGG